MFFVCVYLVWDGLVGVRIIGFLSSWLHLGWVCVAMDE